MEIVNDDPPSPGIAPQTVVMEAASVGLPDCDSLFPPSPVKNGTKARSPPAPSEKEVGPQIQSLKPKPQTEKPCPKSFKKKGK